MRALAAATMAALDREFELKLATGKVVVWPGKNGVNAAHRYVDCHDGATVVAWRARTTNMVVSVNPATMRDLPARAERLLSRPAPFRKEG